MTLQELDQYNHLVYEYKKLMKDIEILKNRIEHDYIEDRVKGSRLVPPYAISLIKQ